MAYERDETDAPAVVSVYRQDDASNQISSIEIQLGDEILTLQLSDNTYARSCSVVDSGYRGPDIPRWEGSMTNKMADFRQQPLRFPEQQGEGDIRPKVQQDEKFRKEKEQIPIQTPNMTSQKSSHRPGWKKDIVHGLRNIEINPLIFLSFSMIVFACIAYSCQISKAHTTDNRDDCRSSHENAFCSSSSHSGERIHSSSYYATDLQLGGDLINCEKRLQDDIVIKSRTAGSLLGCVEKNLLDLSDHFKGACRAAHTAAESFAEKTLPRPWIQAARRGLKKQRRRCMVFVEDTSSNRGFQSGLHMY